MSRKMTNVCDYYFNTLNGYMMLHTEEDGRIGHPDDKRHSDRVSTAPPGSGGAHEEERLNGPPGRVLARRDGTICIGTIDGAVWISHLKAKDQAEAQEVNCFAQADDDYKQQSGRGNAVPIATKPNRLPLRAYECSFQLAPQSAFARPAILQSQAAYAGV